MASQDPKMSKLLARENMEHQQFLRNFKLIRKG